MQPAAASSCSCSPPMEYRAATTPGIEPGSGRPFPVGNMSCQLSLRSRFDATHAFSLYLLSTNNLNCNCIQSFNILKLLYTLFLLFASFTVDFIKFVKKEKRKSSFGYEIMETWLKYSIIRQELFFHGFGEKRYMRRELVETILN